MGAKSILVVAGVAITTLLYLIYLAATYDPPQGTTTVAIPPPVLQPVQPAPAPVVPVQRVQPPVDEVPAAVTEVEEPVVEAAEVVEEIVELPALGDSDSFIMDRLRQVQEGAALLALLTDEQLVRRFVVLVDNVSKGTLPQTNLPYRPVADAMPVRALDDNLFELDEAGFRRFDRVVAALAAVDTEQAVALYRLASPLFQQAYAEIGYRDADFDATLRRAIRNVLDTDEIEGPVQLVKPSVMYLYADSSIEAMSDVQKQMIRIGPQNAEQLKAKLRQLLQLL